MTSIPIRSPLISFSCLIALSRTSSTVIGTKQVDLLVPDFSGIALSFSPFNVDVGYWLAEYYRYCV